MQAKHVNSLLTLMLVAVSGTLAYQNQKLKTDAALQKVERYWPVAGATVPAIPIKTLEGRQVLVGQAPAGRRQALFFFSSACAACKRSMPFIKEAAAAYGRLGIQFIAVTSEQNSAQLRSFLAMSKVDFPVVSDFSRRNMNIFNIRMTPTTIVVDERGDIKHVKVGSIESNKEVFDLVTGALSKEARALAMGGGK
ncbi:MAG TPA: TlpA disulfide reductase family protein [Lysobacter sp.]|nr:TlpA disulfide reductase family protein [Lysobacter sp.]